MTEATTRAAEAPSILSPRSVDESVAESEAERQLGLTDYTEAAQLVPRFAGSSALLLDGEMRREEIRLAPMEAARLVQLAGREGREAWLLKRHAPEGAAALEARLAESEERAARSTLRRAEAAEARAEALQAAALAASAERIARDSVAVAQRASGDG